jgi:uncharacterized protein (DUF362 family)
MASVGLAKGTNSYEAVGKALEYVEKEIAVPNDLPVMLKVNVVHPSIELAATPVNAVRAVLDFLSGRGVERFIIAGAAGMDGDTMGAFRRFGYLGLNEHYDIEFRDLNRDDMVMFEGLDHELAPAEIRVARAFFESYVVSIGRMKAHAIVGATLSMKNVAIGSVPVWDRRPPSLHKPEPGKFTHERKALLNKAITPDLAVIDGIIGMEGDGPMRGTPIFSGVALAGTDGLALDLIGCRLMGYDHHDVGYLHYLSTLSGYDVEKIDVLGEDPAECVTKYSPQLDSSSSASWAVDDWEKYLEGSHLIEAVS